MAKRVWGMDQGMDLRETKANKLHTRGINKDDSIELSALNQHQTRKTT